MDKPVYTNKLDSFSYGVLAIQILTRKFPAPGPPRRTISDPKYGPIPIEVPILEPERRKSHIDLVDPSHPILKVALKCFSYEEKDRPSSGELCSQVGEMKESSQYAERVRPEAEGRAKVELQGQRDLGLSQLREQLEGENNIYITVKECVEELTSQLESAEGRAKVELQGQRNLGLSQLREQLEGENNIYITVKECVEELTSQLESAKTEQIASGRENVVTKKTNGGITDSE